MSTVPEPEDDVVDLVGELLALFQRKYPHLTREEFVRGLLLTLKHEVN